MKRKTARAKVNAAAKRAKPFASVLTTEPVDKLAKAAPKKVVGGNKNKGNRQHLRELGWSHWDLANTPTFLMTNLLSLSKKMVTGMRTAKHLRSGKPCTMTHQMTTIPTA